eukprot:TRINITY_DN4460_c1_g1_i1.p1 TRINITY_DN4460_c1_g1~~TRINITY_DN4460_c1_g1_i1.p1  ORF type:complete len:628 (+),score=70.77 TRINITY_DN4460_c1_g1_i1:242-1885(+)
MTVATPTSQMTDASSIGPLRATPASATNRSVHSVNSGASSVRSSTSSATVHFAGAPLAAGVGLTSEGSAFGLSSASGHSGASSGPAKAKEDVGSCAYMLYYMLLFFSFWFGSNRFDVDGDGDFDPSDVQAYLNGTDVVERNFRQTKTLNDIDKFKVRSRTRNSLGKGNRGSGMNSSVRSSASSNSDSRSVQNGAAVGGPMSMLDMNGDGDVDLMDVVESKVSGPIAVEDEVLDSLWHRQRLPWFTLLQTLVCISLWAAFAVIHAGETGSTLEFYAHKAGADSFWPNNLDLRLSIDEDVSCRDVRWEAYRWLTYQWTHVGVTHVMMNSATLLMMGIPLEGLHGSLRMILMFNVGVLGGAFCYMVADAHTVVVGMSGGCYALIGLHISDLMLNWRQKKFRLPTVFFLLVMIAIDVSSYMFAVGSDKASHTAHVGGVLAGIMIGVLLGKNLHVNRKEIALMVVTFVIAGGLVLFCLIWVAIHPSPRSIFESLGWCWLRQVYDPASPGAGYVCVKCGTQECIDRFVGPGYPIQRVSYSTCQRVTGGFYYEG